MRNDSKGKILIMDGYTKLDECVFDSDEIRLIDDFHTEEFYMKYPLSYKKERMQKKGLALMSYKLTEFFRNKF